MSTSAVLSPTLNQARGRPELASCSVMIASHGQPRWWLRALSDLLDSRGNQSQLIVLVIDLTLNMDYLGTDQTVKCL